MMKLFVICGTHFSHPTEVRHYRATQDEANAAAADLVNILRADLDKESLLPIDPAHWHEGLVEAQRHRVRELDEPTDAMSLADLAAEADFDVWIEDVRINGFTPLVVSDRSLAAILTGLRLLQQQDHLGELLDIATNGGCHEPMLPAEIDELCEQINCADQNSTSPRADDARL